MDPSARRLLENTYEALENAGIPKESLKESNTGCYVGCFTDDWKHLLTMDPEHAPMHSGTGTGFSLLAGRISHYYGKQGPCMTIDTACSSSLVALHQACQSLRYGEAEMALVCGVNMILAPNVALWYSSLRMLSPDGVSRSFAQNARGYGRGEGVATVVLKRLTDALRDGDTIRAVIKGSGVNQDGESFFPDDYVRMRKITVQLIKQIRPHQRHHSAESRRPSKAHPANVSECWPRLCSHRVFRSSCNPTPSLSVGLEEIHADHFLRALALRLAILSSSPPWPGP